MLRYHKTVNFPELNALKLNAFNNTIQEKKYIPSKHCLDMLKYRVCNIPLILNIINDYKPLVKDIFEYSITDKTIDKACYRLSYNFEYDIILILALDKTIITIYLNSVNDKHQTLNKSLYAIA